ncbi:MULTISPECIES: hypothetical protein [unclassified Flavobacterium]|jgi:hypothetical protein|uniref:hypothetical protein n=1 Tax=unclassified Flavobacterium TaxID=196869 RepID=UPI0012A81A72|nr:MULTISPECIES: hypothetical protein [unclassified Flavobacterium]MBF4486905.1 hypothetical protein [Flavobacterium sp. CSZ]QGK76312.1 hypothetical protein GIY83_20250 [Flavobacterium sp. SLB02]
MPQIERIKMIYLTYLNGTRMRQIKQVLADFLFGRKKTTKIVLPGIELVEISAIRGKLSPKY